MSKATELKKTKRLIERLASNFKPPEHLTVTEWADKYRMLSSENSAEAGHWRTSRTPYLKKIMDAFTAPEVQYIDVVASSQVGKALDINTPIPTPNGFTTMGELKVGDVIYDENKQPCRVTFATEVQYNRKCYEITFADEKIVADAEHRWFVNNKIMTTQEMVNEKKVYAIFAPYCEHIFFIHGIKEVETRPVRCIQVDSPNHLYLCGETMIPTHNTEAEYNMLGYCIDNDPAGIIFAMPTIEQARKMSKKRLTPLFRDTPCLKKKIAPSSNRDGQNALLTKSFPGGMLSIVGTNSPGELASQPCRYIFCDEIDRFAASAGNEGNPIKLLEARTNTFYNRKIVCTSTPTIAGSSNIEQRFYMGTQEYWEYKCPHCGQYEKIVFRNIRFEKEVTTVGRHKSYRLYNIYFCCPDCGGLSTEDEIKSQPAEWVAENPSARDSGRVSFWLNGFCSPWLRWDSIIMDFLNAGKDPDLLKTVFNTKFGELYEDRGDLKTEDEMMNRREAYDAEVPDGVLFLTCAVDTQDNRLEYEVKGWGHFCENWGIKKGYIMGRPDRAEVWQRLDDVIDHAYTFKDGKTIRVTITLVDSGGHFTQEVYENCRARTSKNVFAIKGKDSKDLAMQRPFITPPNKIAFGPNDMYKTWLYSIGVNSGKKSVQNYLKVETPGQFYCHYPLDNERGYDAKYFNGLLSEVEIIKGNRVEWNIIPGHERNEPFDLSVYNLAALKIVDPDMDALERRRMQKEEVKEVQKPKKQKVKKSFSLYDY